MRLDELRQIKTVYTLCCRNEPRSEFLRGWLSEAETRDLVALCEEEDVSLHGLILAAGLTAMARYHRKMINQKGIQRCVMWISHFFKASISLSSRYSIHPFIQIILVQNSQYRKKLNKFRPPSSSDDLWPTLQYLSFSYAGTYTRQLQWQIQCVVMFLFVGCALQQLISLPPQLWYSGLP